MTSHFSTPYVSQPLLFDHLPFLAGGYIIGDEGRKKKRKKGREKEKRERRRKKKEDAITLWHILGLILWDAYMSVHCPLSCGFTW